MNDEDIKILEILKETLIKDKFIIPKEPKKWCESIENLLNRNKELEEENTILKEDLHEMTVSNNHKKENWVHRNVLNSYVPVSKIKEKIEESTEKRDFYLKTDKESILVPLYNERIHILMELLEGK